MEEAAAAGADEEGGASGEGEPRREAGRTEGAEGKEGQVRNDDDADAEDARGEVVSDEKETNGNEELEEEADTDKAEDRDADEEEVILCLFGSRSLCKEEL